MMLDTNALSALIDGDAALEPALGDVRRLAIPVIALGEFCYGASQSRYAKRYQDWLVAHLHLFDVLPITEATAAHYATVRADLKKAGKPIPANDVWIAAIARQHGLALVSRDAHFDAVPGLARKSW